MRTATRIAGAVLVAVVIIGCLAGFALAQVPQCGMATEIISQLMLKFKERSTLVLLSKDNRTMTRVYANPDTGTWTIVALDTRGTACIVGAGEGIVSARPQPDGQPL